MTNVEVLNLTRHGDARRWAWAFLRRNRAYQADYRAVVEGGAADLAERWGLAVAHDPADAEPVGEIWATPISPPALS